ncbi:hypothetical protein CkaCkLH20_00604 [Colletotrichum karsti]|uniref:Uncharacterized protein n=1 Tax=Colletotrichum karsti TaxID=1095194 RepID=A0A9P6LPS0_9PEZI|nr:uncharacterized protein CkaCkLH20_00604 [Colletotrichum karsti]KAF9881458.1 hypothetical protein CkaCkLH20_00604 [Colletotrichum karsti]
MRLTVKSLFLFLVSFTFRLVEAGWQVRGVEARYLYAVYRMDVEISAAKAIADGTWDPKDPDSEKPWKLGRDLKDTSVDTDYPDGREGKYGLNWHSFIRATQNGNSNYPMKDLASRIGDSWMPSLKDVEKLAVFEPDDGRKLKPADDPKALSTDKFTFAGFNLDKILGGLNKGKGRPANDDYFMFDNLLKIVGQRGYELHKQDSTRAKPFFEIMDESLREASMGRALEAEKFKLEGARDDLLKFDKEKNKTPILSKKWFISVTTTVGDKENGIKGGDKSELFKDKEVTKLDVKATVKELKNKVGKNANFPTYKERLKALAKQWGQKGTFGDKDVTWGGNEAKTHEDVRKQQTVLRKAMAKQTGGSVDFGEGGCGYDVPADPKRFRF